MTRFSSLRFRLVGTVFLAIMPAWLLMYYTDLPWAGFAVGLLALVAAWFGGERFILRQVRILSEAAKHLAEGDLTSRTGLSREGGELGELARSFDTMAAALEQRVKEREKVENNLLNRALQQTVLGSLGQFALLTHDFSALLNQAVLLVVQTLEVEFCEILEIVPDSQTLVLRMGSGWKPGAVGRATVPMGAWTQAAFTLNAGQPVATDDLPGEARFEPSPLLGDHGIISGVTVAIAAHGRAYGILGAHTAQQRKFTEDEVHFLFSVGTILSLAAERNRAEAQVQKLADFAQLNPNPAIELNAQGEVTYANNAALDLARSEGYEEAQNILPGNIEELVRTCLESRQAVLHHQTELGKSTFTWSFHPVPASRLVHCYVENITERLSLEAQLRQSQKMDSIGQLAAGVAHDFNNMLTIIQGHSGMLIAKAGLTAESLESLQAIYFAAERATSLTRQLLMFSRKNVIQLKPIDLRDIVTNLTKMLQRLLGETVLLEFRPPSELPLIQGDPGMIEQVLMNLAVNARDAMTNGGTLSISAKATEVNEAHAQTHAEARPGQFVCLRVSDTGCGMDAATMTRVFEPFFTTKEVGKGTGLGLATVYGIVKQHEGWIELASQVGQGTTFNVFFPATTQPLKAQTTEEALSMEVRGGKETILIVEDEPLLRDLAHMILEDCGYQVLEAASGREALEVWERHRDVINLVVTDMVMPDGVSGMDLAQKLLAKSPQIRIVFASGYSMEEIDTTFMRKGHAGFLQKPYTHVTLPKAVRECLDK
jgi:signal transduction histidine kinase/ActR/RegA family two-component response regulator